MAYFSPSRCKEIKDIYINGKVEAEGIHASPEALEETERLQSNFDQRIEKMIIKNEKHWRISYLNVCSIQSHKRKDVEKDNIFMSSEIFSLGETWLEGDSTAIFEGFQGSFANYGRGKGVSVF